MVKRKALGLVLLLLIIVALWLTRARWLPVLLNQLPLIKDNSDLIQGIQAAVDLTPPQLEWLDKSFPPVFPHPG
jgi:hypothetical protein